MSFAYAYPVSRFEPAVPVDLNDRSERERLSRAKYDTVRTFRIDRGEACAPERGEAEGSRGIGACHRVRVVGFREGHYRSGLTFVRASFLMAPGLSLSSVKRPSNKAFRGPAICKTDATAIFGSRGGLSL